MREGDNSHLELFDSLFIGATHKGKNLLILGANSFLYE